MGGRPCSCQMGLLVTVPYRWTSWMGLGSCHREGYPCAQSPGSPRWRSQGSQGEFEETGVDLAFPRRLLCLSQTPCLPSPDKVSQYEKSQTSFNLDFIFQAWIDRHQENSSMGANINGQLPSNANPRGTLAWPLHGIWPPSLSSLSLR